MIRQLRIILVIVTTIFLLMVGPVSAETQEPIAGVTGNSSTQVSCALLETMLGGAGISLQNFNISEQGFNLSEQSFNLSEQGFNLSEQNFNISEQTFNISEQTFNLSEQTFNLSEQSFNVSEQYFNVSEQTFNLSEQTFNLSEQTFNLSEQGFTVSEQGFNLSEQGFNVSEQNFNVSEQEFFTWYAPVFQWIGEDTNGTEIPISILMNYSNAENVAAEVALHNAPPTWGKDLLANAGVTTGDITSMYGTNPVAVIFVDVGDVNDSSTHMSKVVGVFNQLMAEANIPNYKPVYIDISDDGVTPGNYNINYRVSKGIDPSDGNYYEGIQGAIEGEVATLLADGYTNIVINMSLAFIPCADEITTESGYTFTWDVDDFVQEYENSLDPNYTPPQDVAAVKPVAECVYTDGKNWFARFGYENNNIDPVWLEAGGNKNRFSPSPQYRDQPSIFETGRHRGVIEIKFSKPSITWELIDQFGDVQMATAYIPGEEPSAMGLRDTATNCLNLPSAEHPAGAELDPNTGGLLPPTEPIQPILECIRYDANGGNPVAVFGYENFNKRTVYVPGGGKDNKFSPNPGNRGQVTHFLPGRQPSVFEVPFKSNEQSISWSLDSNGWFDGTPDFPTLVIAEAYPENPVACADTSNNATDVGNYLATFENVPEGEVLNVLTYLLTTFTLDDDDTNVDGLRGLLAEYLAGSQEKPSAYNIVAVAASGNYRPWFNIMLAEANAKILGTDTIQFLDDHIAPLAPGRWAETIAVSASLGKDAWAFMDDDNNNAEVLANGDFASRTVVEDGDGVVNLWEDTADGEDVEFQWMRWFFSHDGDIMVRGAGYGTANGSIAGTSFASPGAAFVVAQYFTFPDACTFPVETDENGDITMVYPPLRQVVPTGWDNRPLEATYGEGATPLWCDVQSNQAPVAVNDDVTTDEDTAVDIDVLANDTDPDGDTLSVDTFSQASNGTVTLNEDGTLTYTPNENFNGTDSFTYSIVDQWGMVSVVDATVSITVNAVNDAPVVVADVFEAEEDVDLVIAAPGLLNNDSDVEDGKPTVSNAGVAIETTGGSFVTFNSSGAFDYDVKPDFNGTDTFEYTACDTEGACDTATVTINVAAVNDAPVAHDAEFSVDEDTELLGTVSGFDVDGDALTFALDTDASNGSATVNLDGSFSYMPTENFNGTDSFTFVANDGEYNSAPATVTITVNPIDDAPTVVIEIDPDNPDEGGSVDVDVIVTDPDDDVTDATITVSEGDTVIYTGPNTTVTYTPPTDFCGSVTITVTATVDGQTSEEVSITFTFTCVDDAPVAGDDTATTPEDTGILIPVLANDTDVDEPYGDELTVSAIGTASNGTVFNNGDSVTYLPNANFSGTDSFTYEVMDNTGLTDTALVTVTVTPVNDPPNCAAATATVSPSNVISNPFNHTMRLIVVNVTADDPDSVAYLTNVHVSQDEPVNADGDGNTDPFDAEVLSVNGMEIQVNLRAERDGGGDGRVYTIYFTITDGENDCSEGFVHVLVGHDAKDDGPIFPSE